MTDPHAEYLAATRADIARLPEHLAGAKVIDHGEAEWPAALAEEVIRGLIAQGRVVNVLMQYRLIGSESIPGYASCPLGTYEGTDAHENLRWILRGFERLDPALAATICWYPAETSG